MSWNKKQGITPQTVIKAIRGDIIERTIDSQQQSKKKYAVLLDEELRDLDINQLLPEQKTQLKKVLERRMKESAKILDFEGAAYYRDYLSDSIETRLEQAGFEAISADSHFMSRIWSARKPA
jgi:excinuclease UvrABC helicase subunit UvrB